MKFIKINNERIISQSIVSHIVIHPSGGLSLFADKEYHISSLSGFDSFLKLNGQGELYKSDVLVNPSQIQKCLKQDYSNCTDIYTTQGYIIPVRESIADMHEILTTPTKSKSKEPKPVAPTQIDDSLFIYKVYHTYNGNAQDDDQPFENIGYFIEAEFNQFYEQKKDNGIDHHYSYEKYRISADGSHIDCPNADGDNWYSLAEYTIQYSKYRGYQINNFTILNSKPKNDMIQTSIGLYIKKNVIGNFNIGCDGKNVVCTHSKSFLASIKSLDARLDINGSLKPSKEFSVFHKGQYRPIWDFDGISSTWVLIQVEGVFTHIVNPGVYQNGVLIPESVN